MTIVCPWCEGSIKGHPKECPGCGFDLVDAQVYLTTEPRRQRPRKARIWIILAVLLLVAAALVPLGFSVADEIRQLDFAFTLSHYADPLKENVWIDGQAALRAHISQPEYDHFERSSVVISAGNLASFCGSFDFPAPFGGFYVKRFISLEGRNRGAVMEFQTRSFDVLWERLCVANQGSW